MAYKNIRLRKATDNPANGKAMLRCGVCRESYPAQFMYIWYFEQEPINNTSFCTECLFGLRLEIDNMMGPSEHTLIDGYQSEIAEITNSYYPHFIPPKVIHELQGGRKIAAIKEWRYHYGHALKTAKEHIDAIIGLINKDGLWDYYVSRQQERWKRSNEIHKKHVYGDSDITGVRDTGTFYRPDSIT